MTIELLYTWLLQKVKKKIVFKKKIEGQLETVQFLLNKGANVNAIDRFNNTPVQDALRFTFFFETFSELDTTKL
jgi:hypothetical protein